MAYNHLEIEKKWQDKWENDKVYQMDLLDFSKPKYYVLDMFPYPSGQGLHVGHPRGYTATDIISRYKMMNGYQVVHPIGFDAFGLPAEQYALKTNTHPEITTKNSIDNFRKQLKSIGFSYDYSKEINTSDQNYYKWTQWIFTRLYKLGLVYQKEISVNWCPELGTVLANEEVINGKSEVGGFDVIRKPLKQWVLKITDYAEKLLENLSTLDWPTSTIEMQKNWIGKSVGAEITFKIEGSSDLEIKVFTTRADTIYGVTYLVLAPEHSLVSKLTTSDLKEEVLSYINKVTHMSEREREENTNDKSGVFLGSYAINPITFERIPIYIASYVLSGYGLGAVMAVPAHDQRDYLFANIHKLAIKQVIEGDITNEANTSDGKHINSPLIDGLNNKESIDKIIDYLEVHKLGKKMISYKLRDWIFSRQRYWGEPIPIVHLEDGSTYLLEDDELPLTLPDLKEFKPSGDGRSPLANATDWINVVINGKKGVRETDTMPQWAGSCWYFLRYLDPNNANEIADKKLLDHYLPVDLYIGGAEHAVMHLLYARFWFLVLHDIGLVSIKEPFKKLIHQGMILGENNEKMSKSRGNVINPDGIIEEYGADTLRLYEMFMGPLDATLPWSNTALDGIRKFINRVYRLLDFEFGEVGHDAIIEYHKVVKAVSEDIESLKYNTAIAKMMSYTNFLYKEKVLSKEYLIGFVKLLFPFIPHIAEEMHEALGGKEYLSKLSWPTYNIELTFDEMLTIAVQVNGKLRGTISIRKDEEEEVVLSLSRKLESISILDKSKIVKCIYIKNKIVNYVYKA